MNDGESHEDSRQDLPFKWCPTTEVLRHDASITRSEYREGSRKNTPHHVDISHDSPCSRGGSYEGLKHDIHSNHGPKHNASLAGCQSERGTNSLKKTNHQEQGGFQKQVVTMQLSTTTKVLFQNGKGEQQKVSQGTPITTASDAAVLQPQKCTTVRHNVTHKEMNK
ncbi:unnamed protein product, partial [Cuscuta campestris]